jgi:ketosteroid isomerase-like protein
MKKNILILLVSSLAIFSCQEKSENKPAFDKETAQKEINEANSAFENYVSKGDSVGLATNSYTIDAKFMHPNNPSAEGRPAIISAVAGIFNSGITGIKLHSKEIWGGENTITEEGGFELNIKDGTVVEKGKYLVMWKKEDGKWKIHRDMFSSDLPLNPTK